MKAKAAVFYKRGRDFEVSTINFASPGPGEVLVKLKAAGICHCDYHLFTGATKSRLPIIPGHEGAGIVQKLGQGVKRVREGNFVALNWAPNCGNCEFCNQDRPALCDRFVTGLTDNPKRSVSGIPVYAYALTGSFAEYTIVPEEACVPISDKVPAPIAAMFGCSVATGYGSIANTAETITGSTVAILGVGGVGLNAVIAARLKKSKTIIAIDKLINKLKLANVLGATHSLENTGDLTSKVFEITGNRGVDYVIETTGKPEVQIQGLELIRPGGMLVLAGFAPMGNSINLPTPIVTRKEIVIKGSLYGSSLPARDFQIFAELYERGDLELDKLLSRTYRLEEVNSAYADLLQGKIVRGAILF